MDDKPLENEPSYPFLDRLKEEHAELDRRLEKLVNFLKAQAPGASDWQRQLLDAQSTAMACYMHILAMRITDLTTKKLPDVASESGPLVVEGGDEILEVKTTGGNHSEEPIPFQD